MTEPIRGEQGIQGVPGETGPAAPTLKITDRRLLFAFAAMLAIFVLLAWRSEVNADGIRASNAKIAAANHAQAVVNYKRCERALANTRKINATTQAQIDFLSRLVATAPRPDELRRYISIYQQAFLPVVPCGAKP